MKNVGKFVERFGKGIRGYGVVLGVVVAVLLVVSVVKQCNDGATVQVPGNDVSVVDGGVDAGLDASVEE